MSAWKKLRPVVSRARAAKLPVRGYVSCVVQCPYDGVVSAEQVRQVCAQLLEMGVTELDLGDTIGAAVPDDMDRLLAGLRAVVAPQDVTLHLHNTSGRAIAVAERAIALGVVSLIPAPAVWVAVHSPRGRLEMWPPRTCLN